MCLLYGQSVGPNGKEFTSSITSAGRYEPSLPFDWARSLLFDYLTNQCQRDICQTEITHWNFVEVLRCTTSMLRCKRLSRTAYLGSGRLALMLDLSVYINRKGIDCN